jgi:drug/metabolite transporter (DMT)-like permease
MRALRNEYVGVLAAVASSALGGVAGGATRFAIGTSDPVTLGVFRFGVGFLLLLPIALALRIRWPRGRDWLAVAALGVMYFAFFIVLFNLAFRYTTAARGSLALSTLPLMTMLVGAALGVEALDRRKSVGVIIAMAGAAVALVSGLADAPAGAWRGDLIMIAATLVMALYNVWSRPFIVRSSPLAYVTAGMGFGSPASWPWPPGVAAMRALQAFMVRNGWRWFISACSEALPLFSSGCSRSSARRRREPPSP